MKKEVVEIRRILKEKGLSGYYIPHSDAHQSEYISDYDKFRACVSGFTGSAGDLLILEENAYLFTDGRYFIQAEKELRDSGIELVRVGEPNAKTLTGILRTELRAEDVLALNAKLISARSGMRVFGDKKIKTDFDISDSIWENRPQRSAEKIWILREEYTGEDIHSKLKRLREAIKEKGGDALVESNLSNIAWLTNLRGADIECNPLFLSYLFIEEERASIFVQAEALDAEVREYLEQAGFAIHAYDDFYTFLEKIEHKNIILDESEVNFLIYDILCKKNELSHQNSLIANFKVVKNDIEIANMKQAHIRDGAYLTRFIKFIKEEVAKGNRITEEQAANILDNLRAEDEKFVSLSFETISAYGKNAAMPHYSPGKEEVYIENRGMYLVDSGANYKDGTTDITRTIKVGEVSDIERLHYTLVSIGMLRVLNARFPKYAKGINIDGFARQKMWEYGMDYNHGTGHGVGFCNTVHEGPTGIRPRTSVLGKDFEFTKGNVCSNEPGIYIEGSHGIREEILVVVKELENGFLGFESLSFAPLDRELIDKYIMNEDDIRYFNAYQKEVYEKLSPLLNEEERVFLQEATKEI